MAGLPDGAPYERRSAIRNFVGTIQRKQHEEKTMAEDPSMTEARKRLAEAREASDKIRAEFVERTKGRPTPTQEENDLHALGGYFVEHSEDGSGAELRQMEAAKPAATYQTRAAAPRRAE
jgi:hypothetical protein